MFSKSGRKKPRNGAGASREPSEPGANATLWQRSVVLALALSFTVLLAVATRPPEFPHRPVGYDIDAQPVALEEVRAGIDFETEVLAATEQKREEAAAKTPDTYRVDRERVERQLRLVHDRIQALLEKREDLDKGLRLALKQSRSDQPEDEVVTKALMAFAAKLRATPAFQDYPNADVLAFWLTPTAESLPKRTFAPLPKGHSGERDSLPTPGLIEPETVPLEFAYARDLGQLAHEALQSVLNYGVAAADAGKGQGKNTVLVLRENPVGDLKASEEIPVPDLVTPKEAAESLSACVAEAVQASTGREGERPREPERPVDWSALKNAAVEMAKPCLADTLFFDRVYTEAARERARLATEPVLKSIQPGEVIQRSGDKWTAQSRRDVQTYWAKLQGGQQPWTHIYSAEALRALGTLLANAIFLGLILACLVRAIAYLTNKRSHVIVHLYVSLLIMCSSLILGRIVSYVEPSGFVLPLAAGAILVAILANPRVAVITSVLTALLASIQFGYDWRLLTVGGAMSIAGVFSIFQVRRRSDMASAAFKATAIGVLAMLAVTLATDSLANGAALRRILLVLLNGGMCLLIVPAVLSPLEKLFGITTDIQLLEYSDLNNEILSRMAIEMPATYAHCLMLGQIAEAAAEAIGANGLLARVCAYYHDIGKLRRPEYFSENQHGTNVHEGLPPRVSARAIAAHVSHGLDIAQEFHLPKPIRDAIAQHHGTCLIGFFYQQALEQRRHDDIREEDFRYPGPKPQIRETAILMICDAVESGVRSIKNPNEERVREFVEKIIASRSADHQFDECNLTLKDLDTIKEVVTRRVVSALHPRIAYPERRTTPRMDNVIPLSGSAK